MHGYLPDGSSKPNSPDVSDIRGSFGGKLRGVYVREAIMTGVFVVVATTVFLTGIMAGVYIVMAVCIRREDRRYSLAGDAPDRLSRSTRRLNGLARRDLDAEFLRPFAR